MIIEYGNVDTASYGVSGKVYDVRDKVNELIQTGSEIVSCNSQFGDPNPGSLKVLHLEF